MAEIGLVASIFGVAAFGTKVAKSLYETGDVMIHAHQQIASMAKHVSQFTAVLRHLGRVLEAEKGSCSEDLLRDIQKLKRSCRGTFKEINATIRSRRLRPFIPVRWLFKKSKAKELEARLDSEQSMLQTMIQSVTVSKLGDMQSRSKEDSQQISVLRQELDLLKTLIVENYKSAAELRRAEQSTQAEESYTPDVDIDILPRKPSPTPSSHNSSSPNSDNEAEVVGEPEPQMSPIRNDQKRTGVRPHHIRESTDIRASALQPLRNIDSAPQPVTNQASSMLLQMIPYRPISSNPANLDRSGRLITYGPSIDNNFGNDTKPSMEEATKSVRLLLDKWTTSGSAPVAAILNEEQNEDGDKREAAGAHSRRKARSSFNQAHGRPQAPVTDSSDDELNDQDFFPSYNESRPHIPQYIPAYHPPHQRTHSSLFPVNEVWRDALPAAQSKRYVGDHLLDAMRSNGGGIVYMKGNDFRCSYYLDNTVVYSFFLVPRQLIASDESDPLFTEIGKGWVRQEVLDLLGYTYSEERSGHFSISGNLILTEIEELVRLSTQGFYRSLQKRSSQTIHEKGWRERVRAFAYPSMVYPQPAPPAYPNPYTGNPYAGYYDSNIDKENPFLNSQLRNSENYHGPFVPAPGVQDLSLSTPAQNGDLARKAFRVEHAIKDKPVEPELRFTIPGSKPSLRPAPVPPSHEPETDASALELRQARDKLEQLLKKKDEAEKAKNLDMASDLTYYAIPDMRRRIEELERSRQEDQKSSSERKQVHAQPAEVETDSSGSSDGERGSKAHESDASLGAEDLYD